MVVKEYELKKEEEKFTYEDALEKTGTGSFQYFVVIVGGGILFSSYISVGSVAFILPAAQCDLHMDSHAKGRLASIGFVGLIISCHLWGFLSDTLGRRYIIIRCLFVDGLLYLITSLIPYYNVILVLRFINGFASSGAVACIYAYVGEFFTDKNRTKYLMTAAMFASISYTVIPVYAWLTISLKLEIEIYKGFIFRSWRLYYACSGIPSLICVIMIYFLPESPKFLLAKGQTSKSIEILKNIHKCNKKNSEDEYMVKDLKINENEKVAKLESNKNKAFAFLQLMWNQTAPLFNKSHRLNIMLICLTQFLTYVSNGGFYLWLPESMNRLASYREMTPYKYSTFCEVIQYDNKSTHMNNTDVLRLSNYSVSKNDEQCSQHIDITVFTYLGILGVIQTTNLGVIAAISRIFNKKYILLGLIIASISSTVAIEFVHLTDFVTYGPCLLIIFTGAMIPIINSIVVELFPTNLRGMAACLTLMSCRLGTVVTNIIAGMLIDKHCNEFIWIFIVAMSICLVIVVNMRTKSQENEKGEEKEVT